MRILHLSTHDALGGAGRAASRLHQALNQLPEIETSHMLVAEKSGADHDTRAITHPICDSLRRHIERCPLKLTSFPDLVHQSLAWLPNPKLVRAVRRFQPDIIHLHWVQNAFLPIQSISKLASPNTPIVWTFHDMWPVCGMFHHEYAETKRYPLPYQKNSRPHTQGGLDVDAWTWQRKSKAYRRLDTQQRPLSAVTPSHWLASKAKQSALWKNRALSVIPNGIDTKVFKPIDQQAARKLLNLPQNKLIISFGAMFAESDPNKGYRELITALRQLRFNHADVHLALFGMTKPAGPENAELPYPVTFFGTLKDDFTLAALYSASDVTITPSRQESFGLVAAEAQACATPVVAFEASATKEVVQHKRTGYLAEPFNPASLTRGIEWTLEDPDRLSQLGSQAHSHITKRFSLKSVSRQHLDLYRQLRRPHSKNPPPSAPPHLPLPTHQNAR
ncbi:MAG: glycosyltransferase [Verrucomicrobiota bacterium]